MKCLVESKDQPRLCSLKDGEETADVSKTCKRQRDSTAQVYLSLTLRFTSMIMHL